MHVYLCVCVCACACACACVCVQSLLYRCCRDRCHRADEVGDGACTVGTTQQIPQKVPAVSRHFCQLTPYSWCLVTHAVPHCCCQTVVPWCIRGHCVVVCVCVCVCVRTHMCVFHCGTACRMGQITAEHVTNLLQQVAAVSVCVHVFVYACMCVREKGVYEEQDIHMCKVYWPPFPLPLFLVPQFCLAGHRGWPT